MATATKARAAVYPVRAEPYRRSTLEDFPLAPVMEVLDLVEHAASSPEAALATLRSEGSRGRYVHPGLRRWAEHAVRQYLDAFPVTPDAPVQPVGDAWVHQRKTHPDRSGARVYELCAWGRRYASLDGSVRELRLLRLGRAGEHPRDRAEVAVAAYILATGYLMRSQKPWLPSRIRHGHPPPERVRVVEVGCLDGSAAVLFDGSVAEAVAGYETSGKAALRAAVNGTDRRAGRSCAECKLTATCTAVTDVAGLLGIDDSTRPRRVLTVTDARRYHVCPAQAHLRGLQLPRQRDVEYGPEAARGLAVHAWLQQLHARRPPRTCTRDDLLVRPENLAAAGWSLPDPEAALGTRMLGQHAQVCPLHHELSDEEVRVEPVVAAYDSAANVVLVAQPDLLYQDRGAWVWRETKTRSSAAAPGQLLATYPQLALGVLLLAAGALGGTAAGTRVELEVLRGAEPDLDMVDPLDPEQVDTARAVLHALAVDWHGDTTFTAHPGDHCARCEVATWCPDAAR